MNEFLKMKNTESQEVNRLQQLGALAHYFNNGSKGNKGETFNQHSMRQKNFLLNAFLKGLSVASPELAGG